MSDRTSTIGEMAGEIAAKINAARGAREGGSFLSPGDVSDLRRMDLAVPSGAFWRLMVACVPERHRSGDEAERRWALVCQGMAWMAPHAHDASTSPGRALASTGFSSEDRPIRINRLLRAEGDAFEGLFLSACRFLASKAQPIDWRSMSFLALRQGDTERKQLARDFYSPKKAPVPAAT
jgi:CRISPR type I-E-associated protein CasB/Cse2